MPSLAHGQPAVVQYESAEGATLMYSNRLQHGGEDLAKGPLLNNGRTRDERRCSVCLTRRL